MSSSPAVLGCHQSQLACFTLSGDGLKLATASERGTVIRLWDTDKKTKLYELRRGSDYAKVYWWVINFHTSIHIVLFLFKIIFHRLNCPCLLLASSITLILQAIYYIRLQIDSSLTMGLPTLEHGGALPLTQN